MLGEVVGKSSPHVQSIMETLDATRNASSKIGNVNRILSLVESRGISTEIGIAMFDLRSAECYIAQFSDTSTYSGLLRNILALEPDIVEMHFKFEVSIFFRLYTVQKSLL